MPTPSMEDHIEQIYLLINKFVLFLVNMKVKGYCILGRKNKVLRII